MCVCLHTFNIYLEKYLASKKRPVKLSKNGAYRHWNFLFFENFLGLKDKWLNSVWFLTVSVPSSDSKRQTLSLTRSQTTGLQSTVHTAKLDTSDAGNKTKVSVGEKLAKIFPLIRILQMQVRIRNVTIKFHESSNKQHWLYLGIITFPCSFLFPLTEASSQDLLLLFKITIWKLEIKCIHYIFRLTWKIYVYFCPNIVWIYPTQASTS